MKQSIEAQLIETAVFPQVEYRRYRVSVPSLPREALQTVSVFRTAATWADPSRIRTTYYYFHSGSADDRQLRDLGAPEALAKTQAVTDLATVQIVCPAFENSFLTGAYAGWFRNTLRPWAEVQTRTDASNRWIGGASRGGFVALSQFLTDLPSYAGVVATAPGLLLWDFYEPAAAAEYSRSSGVPKETTEFLAGFFSGAFRSYAEYRQQDPFHLLPRHSPDALREKKVLLDVGQLDDLGLHPTTELLDREFCRFEMARHSYESVPNGHHEPGFLSGQLVKHFRFIFE
jgi:hypothetical protein